MRARPTASIAGLGLDDGQHDLAPLGVGHADHRGVADGRVREQLGFDLGGIDVDAARDDEVRGAVGEEEVAVVVEVPDVAEREVVAADSSRSVLSGSL